jgi:hypothetical protein
MQVPSWSLTQPATYYPWTYKTVSAIDTVIGSINAPNYFWFTAPTLSGTENNFNPIPWGSIVYGNLDTTTGMWTCPAAGLWQFTFFIFYEGYSGHHHQ